MTAPALKFLISADDKATSTIKRVKAEITGLAGGAGRLVAAFNPVGAALTGAFSVASIVALTRSTINGLDALNDLADATGASIENLSALEDAAARTGTSMDTVGGAVIKLNKTLADAKPGSDAAAALKALGLSAEELKKLDPAEALRRTAVALAGFADDGNKARLTQELFGKSLKEVAPLLKDLAESGKLNATVTTEQAKAAEAFNIELFKMQKGATDLARALSGPVIGGFNKFFAEIKAGQDAFGGFGAAALALTKEGVWSDAGAAVKNYGAEVKRLLELRKLIEQNPNPVARRGALIDADAEIKKAQQLEAYYRSVFKSTAADNGQTDTTELARRRRAAAALPSLPDLAGIGKPAAMKRGTASNDEEAQWLEVNAEAWGFWEKQQIKAYEAATKLREALVADGAAVFEATRTPLEKLNIELARQQKLLDELGPAYRDTYERAVFAAQDAADAAMKVPEALKEINTFAEEAGRNIQDALGSSLEQLLGGKFESIGKLWEDMLRKMVAQAAAAQLNTYLFGDTFGQKGGNLGGVVGDLFKFLGSFGGTRADGGPVQSGRAYLVGERGPELIVPRGNGTVVPNGAMGGTSITYAPSFAFAGEVSPQMRQAARAEARAEFNRLQRQLSIRGA
jgi:hypothetical protein